MSYSAICPACEMELRFLSMPRPGDRCDRCGKRFLTMADDSDSVDGVIHVQLTPYIGTEERSGSSNSPMNAFTAVGMAAILAIGIALPLMGLFTYGLKREGTDELGPFAVGAIACGLLMGLGLAFVGRQVQRQCVGADAFLRFRSIFSVVLGGLVMLSLTFIRMGIGVMLNGPASQVVPSWCLGLLAWLFIGLVTGWSVALFAPRFPTGHASACAVFCAVVTTLAYTLLLGEPMTAVVSGLSVMTYLPVMVFGALLRRRYADR